MCTVALLTGRGNNTLKDKNVLPVAGHPLLWYPAMAAKKSTKITDFYVSSDCPKILCAAGECGYKPIVRPEKYATPTAQHKDVIIHALDEIEKCDVHPEIIVVLLANSPTVCTEWIDGCIELLLRDQSVTGAVPVKIDMDHHPYRAKLVGADGALHSFFKFEGNQISSNRQDLPKNVFLCHNFWVLRVSSLRSEDGEPPWNFMGNKVVPYEVDESFDIHDMDDIERAEKWLIQHQVEH